MSEVKTGIDEIIMEVCQQAIARQPNVTCTKIDDDHLEVVVIKKGRRKKSLTYDLTFDWFEDGEDGTGKDLKPEWGTHKRIEDHWEVLEVCLNALANDERTSKDIDRLTTDGDGKDCEAIFRIKSEGEYAILKVRQ